MSRPGSDNSPGSSPLAAPEAAAEDTRAQALSLAREAVQAEVAVFGEEQREELRLKFKSLDEVEGGFGTALMKTFPDFLPKPEMLGKTRQVLAQLAVLFELVTVLRRGLQELDVAPPPGFTWTLKCIRSGAASAAAAIDISLSKIRRQGDWSASSMVPERKYIDAMVVSTDAARAVSH